MAQYMADILGDEVKQRLAENLLVGPSKLPMENFLTRFQWDGAKFPLRQPLPNIVDGISKVGLALLPPQTGVVEGHNYRDCEQETKSWCTCVLATLYSGYVLECRD